MADKLTRAKLEALLKKAGCPQFASFTYTAKPSGARLTEEIARHTVLLGFDWTKLYERDVEMLKTMIPTLEGLDLVVAQELLESKQESLVVGVGNNSKNTTADVYVATECPGLKIHNETGDLHINGLSQTKVVLKAADYRTVNSKPSTIAKDKIREALPSSRVRQFNLGNPGTKIKIQKETLYLGDGWSD